MMQGSSVNEGAEISWDLTPAEQAALASVDLSTLTLEELERLTTPLMDGTTACVLPSRPRAGSTSLSSDTARVTGRT